MFRSYQLSSHIIYMNKFNTHMHWIFHYNDIFFSVCHTKCLISKISTSIPLRWFSPLPHFVSNQSIISSWLQLKRLLFP